MPFIVALPWCAPYDDQADRHMSRTEQRYLSIQRAALRCGCSEDTIRRRLHAGELVGAA
jgi:hypothetical protein